MARHNSFLDYLDIIEKWHPGSISQKDYDEYMELEWRKYQEFLKSYARPDSTTTQRPKITEDVKKELLLLRDIAKKKQEKLPVTKNRIITATTQITPDYWKYKTKQVSKYSGTIKEKAIKAYRGNQTLWSRFLGFFQSWIRRIKACLGIKTTRDDYNKWMDRY